MKNLIPILFILIVACSQPNNKKISKTWLSKEVIFDRITESKNNYHMFDSIGNKVGSMVFSWSFENGYLISRDTSQFDDGSVYETAIFTFDTAAFEMKNVAINLQVGPTTMDLDYQNNGEKITGMVTMRQDTLVRNIPVDSAYQQDIFRPELYMLLHSLNLSSGDSLSLRAFVPTGMVNSSASLTYFGKETISVPAGEFDCTVIWLKTDGNMPQNKIWVSKSEPVRIVKFYVPGPELNLELVSKQ